MINDDYYKNGQKIQEMNGNILTYYFKSGKIKAEGNYENGQMDGEWKFYRETGQLWQVGNFKNGKKNGSWVRYDKNDQIEYDEIFEDDKKLKKK